MGHGPPVPPPPRAPALAARVRERPRSDLFGDIDAAGGEAELLKSSSMPLDAYDAKPTGARNESSVLFSLNALKAGRQGPQSAPPRLSAAAAPTAADILGMTAGGSVPGLGMESSAGLLSAPAAQLLEAPPAPRQSTIPPRARMDTTPPVERKRGARWVLPVILAAAVAAAAGAAFVFRDRLMPPTADSVEPTTGRPAPSPNLPAGTPPPAVATTNEPAPAAPSTTVAASPAGAPEPAAAAVEPPPSTTPRAPEPEPLAPAAAARAPAPARGPVSPAPPRPAPAPPSTEPPTIAEEGALAAAIRPPGAPAAAPDERAAADKGSSAGADKVTLTEEGTEKGPVEGAPEPEVTLPPFDTSAAKAALEAAAANAASCKKPDGPTGKGKVQVTFSPKTGRATSANVVEGAFGGTPVGGCVAKLFRAAKVPPFSGDPVSVAKSFSIPD
jgi:hypothetical protein